MNTITTLPTAIETITDMDKIFTISENAHVAGIHGYCCIARTNDETKFDVYATIGNKVTAVGRSITNEETAALVNATNAERFAHYTQR